MVMNCHTDSRLLECNVVLLQQTQVMLCCSTYTSDVVLQHKHKWCCAAATNTSDVLQHKHKWCCAAAQTQVMCCCNKHKRCAASQTQVMLCCCTNTSDDVLLHKHKWCAAAQTQVMLCCCTNTSSSKHFTKLKKKLFHRTSVSSSSGPSIQFEVPDMNTKALQSFELLGTACVCAAAQHHVPKVLNLQKDRCENLKSDSECYISDMIWSTYIMLRECN